MKKIFFLLFFCLVYSMNAQTFQLATVISEKGELKHYELTTGNVHFRIDEEGNLLAFYPENAEGVYEYYDDYAPTRISGNIKKMAGLNVVYFDDVNEDKSGKLSRIGNVNLDYYTNQYSFKDGKLRRIGEVQIFYYDSEFTDGKTYGKIKSFNGIKTLYGGGDFSNASENQITSIGNTKIMYWDEVYGTFQNGKIKSISGKTSDLKILVE